MAAAGRAVPRDPDDRRLGGGADDLRRIPGIGREEGAEARAARHEPERTAGDERAKAEQVRVRHAAATFHPALQLDRVVAAHDRRARALPDASSADGR